MTTSTIQPDFIKLGILSQNDVTLVCLQIDDSLIWCSQCWPVKLKSWPAVALIAATLAALSCQFSVVHVMALQGEEDHLQPEPEHLSVTRVLLFRSTVQYHGRIVQPSVESAAPCLSTTRFLRYTGKLAVQFRDRPLVFLAIHSRDAAHAMWRFQGIRTQAPLLYLTNLFF